MAHLENEFMNMLKLEGPITKGPAMRWERKLETSGIGKNNSLLMQLNSSSLSAKQADQAIKRSVSLSNIQNVSVRGRENSTTNSNKSTPNRSRSRTPGRKSNQRTPTSAQKCADRFIPSRAVNDFDLSHYKLTKKSTSDEELSPSKQEYAKVLSEQLNGDAINARILSFKQRAPAAPEGYLNSLRVLYSQNKTPASSIKSARHIPQVPDRILDAPDLLDDYYLNLVDWSSGNQLAVALGSRLYIWDASTGGITQLMEVNETEDYICSVSWVKEGSFLAVGTSTGDTQIWDAAAVKKLRSMAGHESRVGSLAWNNHILSGGCRTGAIHHHDVRVARHHIGTAQGHTQEVCGLTWSPDGKYLASGGNDNLLNIWSQNCMSSMQGVQPAHSFTQHLAAVKALAWCPWKESLLASGGGTADRCIKFFNCNNGACINSIDTKSQVCSLLWSNEHKEIISSHGFPNHTLTIWKYPTMKRVADLSGHTARVLHMAMSPDGTTVVSGAADETLRLWKCFAVDPVKAKKAAAAKVATGPLYRGIR